MTQPHKWNHKCRMSNTVQPVLGKHLRDIQNLLVKDRRLLNTGTFDCISLFWDLNTCLLNTGCLLNRGGH